MESPETEPSAQLWSFYLTSVFSVFVTDRNQANESCSPGFKSFKSGGEIQSNLTDALPNGCL